MKRKQLFAAVLFGLTITSFLANTQPLPVKIAISKASPNYVKWLTANDETVRVTDLWSLSVARAVEELGHCSGLVLSGGEDVFPGRYGKVADTARCTEMNPHRDSLEFALIARALELKMPIVGICRGNQILNVYLGGTLVIDVPEDFSKKVVHQCEDYLHCFHAVSVVKGSALATMCNCDSAMVTTNHHQAVERLAPALAASAHSADGLIEGVEWSDPEGKSFLVGVQWHPERMDRSNPLSIRVLDAFTRQMVLYSLNHPQSR